jgi:hypothetical protein
VRHTWCICGNDKGPGAGLHASTVQRRVTRRNPQGQLARDRRSTHNTGFVCSMSSPSAIHRANLHCTVQTILGSDLMAASLASHKKSMKHAHAYLQESTQTPCRPYRSPCSASPLSDLLKHSGGQTHLGRTRARCMPTQCLCPCNQLQPVWHPFYRAPLRPAGAWGGAGTCWSCGSDIYVVQPRYSIATRALLDAPPFASGELLLHVLGWLLYCNQHHLLLLPGFMVVGQHCVHMVPCYTRTYTVPAPPV